MIDLKSFIRDVPDFPKKGIVFKDITPLLGSAPALALAVELLVNPFRGGDIDAVVGAESRGFIFGTALAQALSCGFVPIRKPGKLPHRKLTMTYQLEYGQDTLEIHTDGIRPGQRCLVVDDLLATGGTMRACCDLVRNSGGTIAGIAALIELRFLNGRGRLDGLPVHSVLTYDQE